MQVFVNNYYFNVIRYQLQQPIMKSLTFKIYFLQKPIRKYIMLINVMPWDNIALENIF